MTKLTTTIQGRHLCGHIHEHSYPRKMSGSEYQAEEMRLLCELCPECDSKPFSELPIHKSKKRGGLRIGAGRPSALGKGKTITIRIPERYKEHVIKYVKRLSESDKTPFGTPKNYNYRCSGCGFEEIIPEEIIEVAAFDERREGEQKNSGMPTLVCPECQTPENQAETMVFVE